MEIIHRIPEKMINNVAHTLAKVMDHLRQASEMSQPVIEALTQLLEEQVSEYVQPGAQVLLIGASERVEELVAISQALHPSQIVVYDVGFNYEKGKRKWAHFLA